METTATIFFYLVFVNLGDEPILVNLFKQLIASDEREIIDSITQSAVDRKKGEERLFTRYAYFIKEATYKYSLSREDSFDLYSDTIIAAIEKIVDGSFQKQSSLKTWLYSIFHNKYVDLIRKKSTNKNSIHHTQSISDMFLQISDHAKTIIQKLVDKADYDTLRQKLSQIGDNCRQMLLLWADEYTDKEIAALMEYKTPDVVKTSRLRCLDKLKKLYHST